MGWEIGINISSDFSIPLTAFSPERKYSNLLLKECKPIRETLYRMYSEAKPRVPADIPGTWSIISWLTLNCVVIDQVLLVQMIASAGSCNLCKCGEGQAGSGGQTHLWEGGWWVGRVCRGGCPSPFGRSCTSENGKAREQKNIQGWGKREVGEEGKLSPGVLPNLRLWHAQILLNSPEEVH